jgi:hypothetical protein
MTVASQKKLKFLRAVPIKKSKAAESQVRKEGA